MLLSMTRLFSVAITALLIAGCASSSIFTPYPSRAAEYQSAVSTGSFNKALIDLEKRKAQKDQLLFMLERGRLNALAGNTEDSVADFNHAITVFRFYEERAKISLTHSFAQSSALLTNDNAIPYQGEDYERIFLHHYQALNYIALGEREKALVEVRRANQEQEAAKARHERLIEKAEADADTAKGKVSTNDYSSYFAPLDNTANRVKNSFQNAYTFYISALLYEANGQWDHAYIDYKRALEIFPDNIHVLKDSLRAAKKLNRKEDIQALESHIKLNPERADSGSVVVIYEQDFVPAKHAVNIPIPYPYSWYLVSFPIYAQPWQAPISLHVKTAQLSAETETIVDVHALAARALKDQLLPILVRQTLRAYTKRELSQHIGNKAGDAAGLFSTLYGFISEQADRRSWLTLPANAQIARLNLSEGEHTLQLANGLFQDSVTVPVQRGRITLVKVTQVSGRYYRNFYLL